MAKANALGAPPPTNDDATKPAVKPAERARQGTQHIPRCPACVDKDGRPLQCTPKTLPMETRYYCPNGKKCPMQFSIDIPRPIKELDEERKTVDDPVGHPLRPQDDAAG